MKRDVKELRIEVINNDKQGVITVLLRFRIWLVKLAQLSIASTSTIQSTCDALRQLSMTLCCVQIQWKISRKHRTSRVIQNIESCKYVYHTNGPTVHYLCSSSLKQKPKFCKLCENQCKMAIDVNVNPNHYLFVHIRHAYSLDGPWVTDLVNFTITA